MPMDQFPVGSQAMHQNTRQEHKCEPPSISRHQNGRATARDSTGQNTEKGYKPSSSTEINIPDPAELDGRNSADHAMPWTWFPLSGDKG